MVGTEPWFYIHKAHSFQGTWCWCRHRRMIHIGRSSAASTRNWVLPRNPSSSFIPIPLCRQFNPVCWAWMRDRRWRRTRGQGFAVRLMSASASTEIGVLGSFVSGAGGFQEGADWRIRRRLSAGYHHSITPHPTLNSESFQSQSVCPIQWVEFYLGL